MRRLLAKTVLVATLLALPALLACTEQTFVKKDAGSEDVPAGDTADVPSEGTEPGDVDVVEALDDVADLLDAPDSPDAPDAPNASDAPDKEPSPETVPEVVEEATPETQDVEVSETEIVTPPSVLDHVGWFGGAPPATSGPVEHVGSFGMSGGGLPPLGEME
jgi:hypothetical protein